MPSSKTRHCIKYMKCHDDGFLTGLNDLFYQLEFVNINKNKPELQLES